MLNQVIVVGRIIEKPEIVETEEGKKCCNLTIATPRNFKNAEGEYETDFIDCVLWNAIAQNVVDWCNKSDLVGIRGRIQTRNIENGNGELKKITEITAEKVTFLSSKKSEETNEQ